MLRWIALGNPVTAICCLPVTAVCGQSQTQVKTNIKVKKQKKRVVRFEFKSKQNGHSPIHPSRRHLPACGPRDPRDLQAADTKHTEHEDIPGRHLGVQGRPLLHSLQDTAQPCHSPLQPHEWRALLCLPQAQLAPDSPFNTGFLCQFTQDALPEGLVPRLLAFDVVTMQPMEARGNFLRSMTQHLPRPLCTVQWVGPSKYLNRDFIERLPHTITGIMFLGEDPLTVSVCDL